MNKQMNILARYEWEKNSTILDVYTFPPIRETDNKQAKKQTIETYIVICQDLLKMAEENLEKLSFLKAHN